MMRLWMTRRRRAEGCRRVSVGDRCISQRTSRRLSVGTFQTRSLRCGSHRGISHFSNYQRVVHGVLLLSAGASLAVFFVSHCQRCVVAITRTMPQIMVVSSEGYFYSYSIDLENGGE